MKGIAFRTKIRNVDLNMYHQNPRRSHFEGVVKKLIIVNIAIFILQQLTHVWFNTIFLEKYFALSPANIKSGYIWTLVTYSFLHGGLLHILVNMLAIYFVGQILEPIIGSKKLLQVYFVSVLLGGLAWLLLSQGHGQILVGASAAGFGLMTFFCLLYPERPITVLLFFIIPITAKPKWILWGMLAVEACLFLFYELPGKSFIASSGHLGGILGGFIMYQILMSKWGNLFAVGQSKITPKWLKKAQSPKISGAKYTINISNKETTQEEVDRILDKINEQGFGSLTHKEREILHRSQDGFN